MGWHRDRELRTLMAALARKGPLGRSATLQQIPAPTGGWNAREPKQEMQPTDAVILENMIPGTGGVALRGGLLTRKPSAGSPGAVNTLLRYFPAAGTQKLFAVAGTGLYDATSLGPWGSPLVSGLVSDKWQGVNFGTPGGYFLVAASGFDQPQLYDGSTWRAMTLAAPNGYAYTFDPTKLMAPFAYGNRLYFIERNSLRVWYLPTYSIQATGTYVDTNGQTQRVQANDTSGRILTTCVQVLDLASLFTLGGSLVAMADWTRDGGTGSDDYAVLITSAGQVAVYAGYNPNATDSSAFSLVGIFRIPPPIGTRCVIRAGADLAVLTQTGALPFSSILSLSQSQTDQVALTDKIRGAFKDAFAQATTLPGWEMAEYPMGALLLVNVPQPSGTPQQYVMNVLTGAWCNFTGLPATTFSLLGDSLVFGTADGRVVQYDVGNQDDGQPISGICLPAFSIFRQAGKKRFLLARPLYTGAIGYRPAIKLKAEYDDSREILTQGTVPAGGTPWNSPWNSPWGPAQGSSSQWQGIRGVAQAASVIMNVVSNNPFRFDHMDVQFETGGNF
jgi:hypothetical protein